jgi:hypothetical protein
VRPVPSRQVSIRVPIWVAVASASACALIWLCRGIYLYWNDIKLLNFLAAWIPFVLSILIAFVPEHKMSRRKKISWRTSVIAIGFAWSVVLWHQQVIADNTAKQDQKTIVTDAVTQSNLHSDQEIGAVRSDVQGVKTDVQGVKKDLEGQISDTISKSTSDITNSLGKVGTPTPKYAQLQFSLWPGNPAQLPLTSSLVRPNADGSFSVDFTVTNVSDTEATTVELWVYLCDNCEFSGEPKGFDRPTGLPEKARHKIFSSLNPGVSLEKMTVDVKVDPGFQYFTLGFVYSCATCGKLTPMQKLSLSVVNPGVPPN